jgi:hypothetical protein
MRIPLYIDIRCFRSTNFQNPPKQKLIGHKLGEPKTFVNFLLLIKRLKLTKSNSKKCDNFQLHIILRFLKYFFLKID